MRRLVSTISATAVLLTLAVPTLTWFQFFRGGPSSFSGSKYVRKSDLKFLSWSKDGESLEEDGNSWFSWMSSYPSKGLFMRCTPVYPDHVCPVTLKSGSCVRDSPENPWSCRGSLPEDKKSSLNKEPLSTKNFEIQINFLGVDCPDEKEDFVNPRSCILNYSVLKEKSQPESPISKKLGFLREACLFLGSIGIFLITLYLARENLARERLRRKLTSLKDLIESSRSQSPIKSPKRSELPLEWGGDLDGIKSVVHQPNEDDLVTFPPTPNHHHIADLSLLNNDRRYGHVYLAKRKTRKNNSRTKLN